MRKHSWDAAPYDDPDPYGKYNDDAKADREAKVQERGRESILNQAMQRSREYYNNRSDAQLIADLNIPVDPDPSRMPTRNAMLRMAEQKEDARLRNLSDSDLANSAGVGTEDIPPPNSPVWDNGPRQFRDAASLWAISKMIAPQSIAADIGRIPYYALQGTGLLGRLGSYYFPAEHAYKNLSEGVTEADKVIQDAKTKIDPKFVPLLEAGGILAAKKGVEDLTSEGEDPATRAAMRKAFFSFNPVLKNGIRFRRYSPTMTDLHQRVVDDPMDIYYASQRVNEGSWTAEDYKEFMEKRQQEKAQELQNARDSSIIDDVKGVASKIYNITGRANDLSNNKGLGTAAAIDLGKETGKALLPWPYKAVTYLPAGDMYRGIRNLWNGESASDQYTQSNQGNLADLAEEATTGGGIQNYYDREIAPLYEDFKNAPASEKPRLMNDLINKIGGEFDLEPNEIQSYLVSGKIDELANKSKDYINEKSRLNQYVPGYNEVKKVNDKAESLYQTTGDIKDTTAYGAGAVKGLAKVQEKIDEKFNRYSTDELIELAKKRNPSNQWQREEFVNAFRAMPREQLARVAGLMPNELSAEQKAKLEQGKSMMQKATDSAGEYIEEALGPTSASTQNPEFRIKNDYGVIGTGTGTDAALQQAKPIEQLDNMANKAHQGAIGVKKITNNTTKKVERSINNTLAPAQDTLDTKVIGKANQGIDTLATKAKDFTNKYIKSIQPAQQTTKARFGKMTNQPGNPPAPPAPTTAPVKPTAPTPPVVAPAPATVPAPTIKKGSLNKLYNLGRFLALSESGDFSKISSAGTAVVRAAKLVPQAMDARNLQLLSALTKNKVARRSAGALGAAEVANAMARASADKTRILLENQPKDVESFIRMTKDNYKRLEDLASSSKLDQLQQIASIQKNFIDPQSSIAKLQLHDIIASKGIPKLLEESVLMNPIQGIQYLIGAK